MNIHSNTLFTCRIVACGLLTAISVNAAVVVIDKGLTAPILGANDTGLVTPTTGLNRIGWDTETFTQTFTTPIAGTIRSIFLGYNAFDNGDTLTLNLSVNGNSVQTGIVLDGNNFSGVAATDGNSGPFYWMEFDLSGENVSVIEGLNTFEMDPTGFTGVSWPLAARTNGNSNYAGGGLNGSTTQDLFFAVTVTPVPEPSTSLLVVFAGSALLLRRRR